MSDELQKMAEKGVLHGLLLQYLTRYPEPLPPELLTVLAQTLDNEQQLRLIEVVRIHLENKGMLVGQIPRDFTGTLEMLQNGNGLINISVDPATGAKYEKLEDHMARVKKTCTFVLNIKENEESPECQALDESVRNHFMREVRPSRAAASDSFPPALGGGVQPQVPAAGREDTTARTQTASLPPEPVDEEELEELIQEGSMERDSLTNRLAGIMSEVKSLEANLRTAGETLEEQKGVYDAKLAELDGLCDQIGLLNVRVSDESTRRDEKQRELDNLRRDCEALEAHLDEAKAKKSEAEERRRNAESDAEPVHMAPVKVSAQAIILATLSQCGISPARSAELAAAVDDAAKHVAALQAIVLIKNVSQKIIDDIRGEVITLQKAMDDLVEQRQVLRDQYHSESTELKTECDDLNVRLGKTGEFLDKLREELTGREAHARAEAKKAEARLAEIASQAEATESKVRDAMEAAESRVRQAESECKGRELACALQIDNLQNELRDAEAKADAFGRQVAQAVAFAEKAAKQAEESARERVRAFYAGRLAAIEYVTRIEEEDRAYLRKSNEAAEQYRQFVEQAELSLAEAKTRFAFLSEKSGELSIIFDKQLEERRQTAAQLQNELAEALQTFEAAISGTNTRRPSKPAPRPEPAEPPAVPPGNEGTEYDLTIGDGESVEITDIEEIPDEADDGFSSPEGHEPKT